MNKSIPLLFTAISFFAGPQQQASQVASAGAASVKKLAFEVVGGGIPSRTDIFVVLSPQSKPKHLLEGLNPTWSPDGQKIAYCVRRGPTTFGQIELINADGSGHTQLTKLKGGACPTDWSPDGEKIAFIAYGGKTPLVFVMSKSGENLTQIAPGYGARWSPDGKQLVFCRPAEGRSATDSIWVASADGTRSAKVIEDNSQILEVNWFPDGKSIVFSSERESKRRSAIFRVNADGTDLEAIAADNRMSFFFRSRRQTGNKS